MIKNEEWHYYPSLEKSRCVFKALKRFRLIDVKVIAKIHDVVKSADKEDEMGRIPRRPIPGVPQPQPKPSQAPEPSKPKGEN